MELCRDRVRTKDGELKEQRRKGAKGRGCRQGEEESERRVLKANTGRWRRARDDKYAAEIVRWGINIWACYSVFACFAFPVRWKKKQLSSSSACWLATQTS